MTVKNITPIFLLFVVTHRNYLQGQVQLSERKKMLTATAISLPVKIDGKLNESMWLTSPAADSFSEIEPVQGAKSKFPTSVKVL